MLKFTKFKYILKITLSYKERKQGPGGTGAPEPNLKVPAGTGTNRPEPELRVVSNR